MEPSDTVVKPVFSVVVPVYNEEEVLEASFVRLAATMRGMDEPFELLFVNDGSRDKSADILKRLAIENPEVRVLHFARNFGHQIAVTAGLDAAIGDVVVIIDCDLQDPPEVIPEMVVKWREGYDVVYGKRAAREGETAFKKFTAFCFYRIMQRMINFPMPTDVGDFRLVSRPVVDTIRAMPEHNRYLRGMFSWVGFKQTAVEFKRDKRFAGETKYPFSKMLALALNGIVSFSNKPLDLIAVLGFFLMGIGSIWLFILLILLLVGHTGMGIPALCGLTVLLAGMIMGSLGVIGAYLGRIYDEVKGRPLYVIARRDGFFNVEDDAK